MSDDKPADVGLAVVFIVLAVVVAMFLTVTLWASRARTEELSEISVTNAAYCSLHAREMVFIDMMHGPSLTADSDFVLARAKEHYANCLAVLPALLPLPDDTGSLQTWIADIRDLLVLTGREKVADVGTEPATAKPSDEGWRQACRASYVSWEEETGTVVRMGSPDRVKCPLIEKGGEWVLPEVKP